MSREYGKCPGREFTSATQRRSTSKAEASETRLGFIFDRITKDTNNLASYLAGVEGR